jgi:FkbM family methyltransferase
MCSRQIGHWFSDNPLIVWTTPAHPSVWKREILDWPGGTDVTWHFDKKIKNAPLRAATLCRHSIFRQEDCVTRLLKQVLKRLLAQFGLVIFKRSSGLYFAEDKIPALALKLCSTADPLVIDGGAHRGAFVDAIRAVCPGARLVCFEPDPVSASALRERFSGDKNLLMIQSALGADCGNAVFNINRSRATNSLSTMTDATTGLLNQLTTTVDRIEVAVTTLDEAMRAHAFPACDFIKLDLQGHDLEALKGAKVALKSAKVVIVEVWFTLIYARSATFAAICEFMSEHGFAIYSLAGLHYGTDGRLLWSDALFVRNDAEVLKAPVNVR